MNFDTLLYEKQQGKGIIFFNRANKLNSLNKEVYEEIKNVLNDARDDPNVKILIFTGGLELFGAGADIEMLSDLKTSAECYNFSAGNDVLPNFRGFWKANPSFHRRFLPRWCF